MIPITLISLLILFIEMLVIRWIGTEIRVFAYLQNGVLVATFLGLGLGCRNARLDAKLLPAALALLFIALVIRDPFGWHIADGLTQGLVSFQDSVVWQRDLHQQMLAQLPYLRFAMATFSVIGTLLLLFAVAYAFYPMGQLLGRWLDEHPRPIPAYTANIFGSILGIALFDAASVMRLPPWAWWLMAALGLCALCLRTSERWTARLTAAGALIALPLLALPSSNLETIWSPYQMLTVGAYRVEAPGGGQLPCGRRVLVNKASYQLILDTDPDWLRRRKLFTEDELRTSRYNLPYEIIGDRARVLVVGAGTGNDVAAALRAGAKSVTAVEIDPAIVELGRRYHPNRPYQSDRVQVTVDDARAYFRQSTKSFDLVWFGLLDSHTTLSAYTNVRLDHFVYTRESFQDMKALLAPDGVVVLLFRPETYWIADRLVVMLKEAFGTLPLSLSIQPKSSCISWGGLMLIAGQPKVLQRIQQRIADNPVARAALTPSKTWRLEATITTDDWPYIYLERPSLPSYHLVVALACLGIAFALRRRLFGAKEALDLPMLLLGAGFMLVEVSGVSRAAQLFGTTWTVNAYVVGMILALVLLANLTAHRVAYRLLGWPLAGLLASVTALAFFPAGWIAGMPTLLRVAVGGLFLSAPVYFSGLFFIKLWARSERRDLAFGSNLLGSLLGGIASMLSMAVGFRALTLLTLAIYLGAVLVLRRQRLT